jgi:hypothetical protein
MERLHINTQTKARKRTKKFSLVRTKQEKITQKEESLLIPKNKRKQPTKESTRRQESKKLNQQGRYNSKCKAAKILDNAFFIWRPPSFVYYQT